MVPNFSEARDPARNVPARAAGFTVIELMITVALLAILTALALPSFRSFIQNNRLASQANEIVAASQLARSEALKRGVNVAICSSDDGQTCTGNFNDGYIVLADPGGDDEELVRVYPAPGDGFVFTPATGQAVFTPEGFATNANEITLLIMLPGCTTDNARRILVENTGRVASQRVACP